MKITKDMSIGEVIKNYPQTIPVFLRFHLTCMGCPKAMTETIEMGAKSHGIKIDELIKDLNESVEE